MWLAQAQKAFHELFAHDIVGDFTVELDVEPEDETPRFGPLRRVQTDQGRVRINLVQILANDLGIGQRRPIRLDQDRHVSGGVEGQKIRPPFPYFLYFQVELKPFLRQGQTDLAGKGVDP